MTKKQRFNKLKSYIKPLLLPVFNPNSQFDLISVFETISKEYDVEFEIGTRLTSGGGFWEKENLICIGDILGPSQTYEHIFSHELAHKIQGSCFDIEDCDTLDDVFTMEREAERLAYFIHKQYFGKRDHRKFAAYRSKKDREWLINMLS